ncbi:DMT family transporter [Shewanella fidelis]|uniref:DMT family transporter n=1 Tax=Shewanella fidelis TaxID=173509 RepID=A0AAW8NJ17_9GAMM|nr:DMT family transporter [Shewanella fidelis]MDR8522702.1 DMT family transporter [Shewanella fidelis]MDW4812317.1 DMT family transporter [Shewanella fidelis]MDW4816018.1 DMT family transporter [Shewanella fidelis]MDW4820558.1 DMT family transporter [Shewanella fidelis]MDW4824781.1 DMT family transporter [Shewanella fidelis]
MRGVLYLFVATLLAAMGWIASKVVVQSMAGEMFIASRFILASLILVPFCYKSLLKLTFKQVLSACGVGVFLGLALQVWIYAVSISDGLSEGAFIMSLAMIIAPLTAWLLFQVKPNRAFWVALPLSVSGMMLMSLTDGWKMESSQLLFLLASALLSVHFVMNKRISGKLKPLVSICLQLFVVGLVGLLYTLYTEPDAVQFSNQLLVWFVISTVAATSVRYLLQTMGQYKVSMETAALLMILEPVWTLLLSISVLGETLELQKLIGGGVIFLSLITYIKLSRRYAKAEQAKIELAKAA